MSIESSIYTSATDLKIAHKRSDSRTVVSRAASWETLDIVGRDFLVLTSPTVDILWVLFYEFEAVYFIKATRIIGIFHVGRSFRIRTSVLVVNLIGVGFLDFCLKKK